MKNRILIMLLIVKRLILKEPGIIWLISQKYYILYMGGDFMGKVKIKNLTLVILLMLLIICLPSMGLAEEGTLEASINRLKDLLEIGEE